MQLRRDCSTRRDLRPSRRRDGSAQVCNTGALGGRRQRTVVLGSLLAGDGALGDVGVRHRQCGGRRGAAGSRKNEALTVALRDDSSLRRIEAAWTESTRCNATEVLELLGATRVHEDALHDGCSIQRRESAAVRDQAGSRLGPGCTGGAGRERRRPASGRVRAGTSAACCRLRCAGPPGAVGRPTACGYGDCSGRGGEEGVHSLVSGECTPGVAQRAGSDHSVAKRPAEDSAACADGVSDGVSTRRTASASAGAAFASASAIPTP